ncbi:unnamed protein product [Aphanomyces euteiches]|uniref:Transmembrane protein n=1 Tax=Aphanomyces euteiches TaxID=100861 RepID=A0A6G0XHK8_9STRA|nr:hypothetical protein Ae201684_004803 [Aphanomyces euteiches]KAH9073166.1 hypothetical protein Ae201684P_014983 [Aphanomyces euteiches]
MQSSTNSKNAANTDLRVNPSCFTLLAVLMAVVYYGALATDLSLFAFCVMALGQVLSAFAAVVAITCVIDALDCLLMCYVSMLANHAKAPTHERFSPIHVFVTTVLFGTFYFLTEKDAVVYSLANFCVDSMCRWILMIVAWHVIRLVASVGDWLLLSLLSPVAKRIKFPSKWMMPHSKLERGELSLHGAKMEVSYVRTTALCANVYGVDIVVDRANTWSITATMAQVRSLRDCMAYEVDDGEMLHTFQIDSGRNHIEANLVGGAIASQLLPHALIHSIHS